MNVPLAESPVLKISTSRATIRVATPTNANRVVETVVRAFTADPFVRYWLSESDSFRALFPDVVMAFGGGAFHVGTAYYVDGFAASALWLPPGVEADEEALLGHLLRGVPHDRHADLFAVLGQMESNHPTEPHWYLPLIGVEPAHQRKGLGSELLRHALHRIDGEHLPAYLEATSPENIPLYERHGFELAGEIQAGASPPIYPMLRPPRS